MTSSITLAQQRIADDQYQEALEISELLARVDSSLLYQITKIFAPSKDKRVKRGGCLFTAHLLRFSVLDQLSLFPGSEICDVAKITIPNILKLCLDKARFHWPWCYDTTLKYIGLLVAAGILIQRKGERGIYYLPLGPYVLLPDHASQHIEKLTRKRAKVSRSAAFQRTVQQCLAPPTTGTVNFIDSAQEGEFNLDAQEIQHTLQAIQGILQSQQGVTLLPSTLCEVLRVLTEHTPRVLQKRSKTPIIVPAQSLMSLTTSSRAGDSTCRSQNEKEATHEDGWPTSQQYEQNLSCSALFESTTETESTTHGKDLRPDDHIVDSALSDSVISLINKTNKTLSDITEFTIGGKQRRARAVESTAFTHMADSTGTNEHQIGRESESPDLLEKDIRYWAVKLSRDISGNDSKIKHYANLLRQSPEILHIAIVDALVRSHFPDPHRKQDRLKGGWITDRYKAYRAGEEVPPPEIYAWSQTGMTYRELEVTLSAMAEFQDARKQRRTRPFPDDVPDQLIVDSCDVADFWLQGGGYGLEEMGYLFVCVNEDLLTPRQYQQLRHRELQAMLDTDPLMLQPETEDEWWTYFGWYCSSRYSPEEITLLLDKMPAAAKQMIREQVYQLEAVLDPARFAVEVVLLPIRSGTPIERGLLIEVRERQYPTKGWLLNSMKAVVAFLAERIPVEDGTPVQPEDLRETGRSPLMLEVSSTSECGVEMHSGSERG